MDAQSHWFNAAISTMSGVFFLRAWRLPQGPRDFERTKRKSLKKVDYEFGPEQIRQTLSKIPMV